jgi:hypothetical protein
MHRAVRFAHNRHLTLLSCLLAASLALPSHAATPSVERIGALTGAGVSDGLKKAVDEKGYSVVLGDGGSAQLWFARMLQTKTKDAAGALYPELTSGEFVAVVTFPKGSMDYRGQAIPAGTYTLRYQYLPQDANHMGVSPNPDFLLAIPVALDPDPATNLPYKTMIALSAKTTGTSHPAVIAMGTAGSSSTVSQDDQAMTILTVEMLTSSSGKSEKLGIVLKGQTTQ